MLRSFAHDLKKFGQSYHLLFNNVICKYINNVYNLCNKVQEIWICGLSIPPYANRPEFCGQTTMHAFWLHQRQSAISRSAKSSFTSSAKCMHKVMMWDAIRCSMAIEVTSITYVNRVNRTYCKLQK